MQIEIITYQEREPTVLERINKKETVYLCIDNDKEGEIMFGTPSYSQATRYARLNNCFVSEYPPGRLNLDNIIKNANF
jgi:hypothetical protein